MGLFGNRNEKEELYYPPDAYTPPTHQRITQSSESDMEYAEQVRNERIANVLGQLNPDVLLDEIEHRLKGERKKNGEWVKIVTNSKDAPPILIKNVISHLSAILHQNTTMGNLNASQINRIMKLIIEYTMDDLCANAYEYGFYKEDEPP